MDINNSRIAQFLYCPQSFKHRYLVKVVLKKRPGYFVLGEAIHKFIEMYYRTKDPVLALRQIEQVFLRVDRSLLNREEVHDLECDLQTAMGIGAAYPQFYSQDFDTYQKFLTEQAFKIPLGNGHNYFGTLDALLQDHAGDWWILETKTAAPSSLNDDYFERVKIDSQVTGYMYGAKQILGSFPRGVVYNVIKKPGIRLKAAESLSQFQKRVYLEYTKFAKEKAYFTRLEIMLSQHRLDSWLHETSILVEEIATRIKKGSEGVWVKNTGSCKANYGTCAYLNACISDNYNKLLYEKDTSGK